MIKIETDRLVLREYTKKDWQAVHLYAKQEAILIYQAWGPNTIEETQKFIADMIEKRLEKPRSTFELAITLKSNGLLIGGSGFHINIDNRQRGDFGYIINPDYWNKGYATEAAKGTLKYMIANQGIKEIEATCDVLNLASKRVLEKCGMKLVELRKSDIIMKGRKRDSYFFEKIINE